VFFPQTRFGLIRTPKTRSISLSENSLLELQSTAINAGTLFFTKSNNFFCILHVSDTVINRIRPVTFSRRPFITTKNRIYLSSKTYDNQRNIFFLFVPATKMYRQNLYSNLYKLRSFEVSTCVYKYKIRRFIPFYEKLR